MKKHFLLLVMALMSISAWALDLDGSKFLVKNVEYGGSTNPSLKVTPPDGYTTADYEIDFTKWYSDEACTTIATNPKTGAAYTIGTLPVGKYYLKIVGHNDYAGLTAVTSFNVLSVTLNISFSAASITYGQANPASYTATLKKGEDNFPNTDNILGLTTGRKGTNDAGVYDYTYEWTNKNFDVVRTDENKFTIEPKNIGSTAAAADKATITKEQGDVVYTGNEIIGVYTIKAGDKTLTAGTAPVLFANVAEYNAAKDPDIDEVTFAGLADADKIKTPGTGDYYVAPVTNAVANFKPTITFQGNYTGTLEPTTGFEVAQAPVTVIVKDVELTYDNENHKDQTATATSFDFAGLVGGDILNATTLKTGFATAITSSASTSLKVATDAIDAGNYTLTLTTEATLAGNYKFTTFVPGTLKIKQRVLTVRAVDVSKAVGAADPTSYKFTITDGSLLSKTGDGAFKDALSGVKFTRESNEAVGEYDLTPDFTAAVVTRTAGATTSTVTSNYDFKAATPKGQLTITEGTIVVTLLDAEKFYGEADPEEFKYTVSGLQGDDELLPFTPTRDKTAANPEAVKAYAITATVENPNSKRYASVVVVPGIFTIKKAQLEMTMPVQNITNEVGTTTPLDVTKLTKTGIKADGIKKTTDKIEDLITLAYAQSTAYSADQSYDNGYTATLTDEAKACYEIVKVNGLAVSDAASLSTSTKAVGKLIVGAGTLAALPLSDADAVTTNFDDIKAANGETVTVTIALNRAQTIAGTEHNWKKGMWNCMVLPFETSARQISNALGYAIVNVVDPANTTEGNVKFKLEMLNPIPANTPFFVKTDADLADLHKGTAYEGVAIFDNVKIVAPETAYPSVLASSEAIGYKFVGAYTKKVITGEGMDNLRWRLGDVNEWNWIKNGSTATWSIRPFNAYMDLGATADAREIIFTFEELDGSMTAIRSIDVDNAGSAKAGAKGWYTLGGMKLNGAPAQKGVYIKDGKKFVIK